MTSFNEVLKALAEKRHVRRKGWGEGSTLYADGSNQLMRTRNNGAPGEYGWTLDLNDLTAKDWQVVETTSNPLQTTI